MSITSVVILCICFFLLGIELAASFVMPEKFPFNYYEIAGSIFFIIAVILWGIGRG